MDLRTILWGVSVVFFVQGCYFYWKGGIFHYRTIIASIVLTATSMALGTLYAGLGSNLAAMICLLFSIATLATATGGVLVLAINDQSTCSANDVLKKQLRDRDELDSGPRGGV